jgi:hypothetical protein
MGSTLTIQHILESKTPDLYMCCLGIYKPITQGRIVLSRIRRSRYQIYIDKALEVDWKTKMEILDALSDVVARPYRISDLPKLMDELDEVISKLEELRNTFKKMDDLLKKLNEGEQEKIFKVAIFTVRSNVEAIRSVLGWVMWEEEVDDAVIRQMKEKGFCFTLTQPNP